MIAVSKRSLDVKSFVDMCSKTPAPPTRDAVRRGSNGSSARPPGCRSRAAAAATTAAWPARVRLYPFRPVTLRVAAGHGSSAGHGPVVPGRMAHPAATWGRVHRMASTRRGQPQPAPRGASVPIRVRLRRCGLGGFADGNGIDPVPRRARRQMSVAQAGKRRPAREAEPWPRGGPR